jgi:hypothetical protein
MSLRETSAAGLESHIALEFYVATDTHLADTALADLGVDFVGAGRVPEPRTTVRVIIPAVRMHWWSVTPIR